MTSIELRFLPNDAGEAEGLGDAGIETFRGTPYASCAREAGQNSLDAKVAEPVRLCFDVIEVPASEFPGHAELEQAIRSCRSEAKSEKEKDFFNHASKVITLDRIPVLSIADYNTKGLKGPPDEDGTPFHALVKASGVSQDKADTSGGSFGIGKNASFAVSNLQTVFYSTTYRSGENILHHAQGKTKLVSHTDTGGQPRRATGYWGNPDGFTAISEADRIPDWIRRDVQGTSLFCAGFRQDSNWKKRMAYSLVTNFFAAVERGVMEFEIDDGSTRINASTIAGFFQNEEVRGAAEETGHLDDFEFASELHRCLTSDAASEKEIDIENLGRIKVRILTAEGLSRRVGFVRNGMLITRNLRHFGHPLERFPATREFVALVEPADDNSSGLLKRLENPAHDEFSAERIADPVKAARAKHAMRILGHEIREAIKEGAAFVHDDEVVLDELAQLFAEEGETQNPPDDNAEHNPEKLIYSPARKRKVRKHIPVPADGDEGGQGGNDGSRDEEGGGTGTGTGSGEGGTGEKGEPRETQLLDPRNTLNSRGHSGIWRTLHFTPSETGKTTIGLEATGINDVDALEITETSSGQVRSGAIVLDLKSGARTDVEVRLSEAYTGPLELVAVIDAKEAETTA